MRGLARACQHRAGLAFPEMKNDFARLCDRGWRD
jgi:hypothetical protein